MHWRLVFVISLLFGAGAAAVVATESEPVRYEFDHVEAEYAVRFVIQPDNVTRDNWAFAMAGGPNGTLNVTYGTVRFWKDNESEVGHEGFLRLEGANGSRRFLVNSASSDWEDNYTVLVSVRSFFWSAKRLDNATVVKDFTEPILSVELMQAFDVNGTLSSIHVATSNDGNEANRAFWDGFPTSNTWSARMDTVRQAGNTSAAGGPG